MREKAGQNNSAKVSKHQGGSQGENGRGEKDLQIASEANEHDDRD